MNLVGDRSGQFARRRHAIHIGELGHRVARHHLGGAAAAVLVDEPDDEGRLHEKHGGGRHNLGAILLPCLRVAKTDFAALGQSRLADSPALQLAPIEHRTNDISLRNGNIRCALAIEYSERKVGCLLADSCRRQDVTTDAAMAETGLGGDDDGPVRDFSDIAQRVNGRVRRALAVGENTCVDDRYFPAGLRPVS